MIPRPAVLVAGGGSFALHSGTPVTAEPGLERLAARVRDLLPGGAAAGFAGLGDTGLGDAGLADAGLGDAGLGDTGRGDARLGGAGPGGDRPASGGSGGLASSGSGVAGPGGGIRLRVVAGLAPEGYVLDVGATGIDIRGGSPAGVHHGVQTLRQLLPADTLRRAPIVPGPLPVPAVHIEDAPRFGWRGVLLDVARHFMPVADVLRFIDLAAFHKLNVLHLHLTDDQGWRVEVPSRPRLTTVGAWRPRTMLGSRIHDRYDDRPHGGYYSTGDLREIVAYAAERHVTVVPEIDMPGHMQAAIAAYPELGNGFAGGVRTSWGISPHVLNVSDEALDFCREVLDHVVAIFPGELIGIGGDECPFGEWDTPAARARIAAAGLAGPHELQ
ncbi:family 20 glycosylhydrolase, partial [Actinoplanes sp. NPDC048791]|uniref:beta-N-acetylhexosaminidase n=1 Tax=Actinoplanes sp. NPDC048791 TaxID=3154623 RepID=UPI0033FCCE06